MDAKNIIVGLDIGTTKIACLIGRKNEHGKVEIIGRGVSESLGVLRGVVSNIDKTVESIRLAVQQAEQESGIKVRSVNVGIAGQHIKSVQNKGMRIRQNPETEIKQEDLKALIDDMYKMVMLPGEEIIHVLPQEYTIDNEKGITETPVGMCGSRLEADFHVIIGQVAAARNILRCVQRAGLEMEQLILEPLASSESVLTMEEKEAGVVLVDIGGGTTDIAIFKDGIIRHTAVIPFGGNSVTEDIKTGCLIMKKQAEALKVKYGSAIARENKDTDIIRIPGLKGRDPKEISMKTLAQIIEARMGEIIDNVYFEIKGTGYAKSLIGGIVITGGGAALRHLSQLVQYRTAMDCRLGQPTEHVVMNPKFDITGPNFATGVGLVLMGTANKAEIISKPVFEEPKPEVKAEEEKPKRPEVGKRFWEKVKDFFDDEEQ
jgi:cell division protein FtsA